MKIGERVLFLCAMSAANNFADNFGLGTDVGFDEEKAAGHSGLRLHGWISAPGTTYHYKRLGRGSVSGGKPKRPFRAATVRERF